MLEFSISDVIQYGGLLLALAGLYWKMRMDVTDARRRTESEVQRLQEALARTDKDVAGLKEDLRLLNVKSDQISGAIARLEGLITGLYRHMGTPSS